MRVSVRARARHSAALMAGVYNIFLSLFQNPAADGLQGDLGLYDTFT